MRGWRFVERHKLAGRKRGQARLPNLRMLGVSLGMSQAVRESRTLVTFAGPEGGLAPALPLDSQN